MGRKRAEAWGFEQSELARSAMGCFCNRRTVALLMGCPEGELDARCRATFGKPFRDASEQFRAQSKAALMRRAVEEAMDGNTKMMQMLWPYFADEPDEQEEPEEM